jgi:hypothetical protein
MEGGYKEKMDMRSRNQYLETLMPRYLKADRKDKTSLLDEYCLNTGQICDPEDSADGFWGA